MDFGEFEGKNYIELQKNPNYQAWIDSNGTLPFPGGESREAFIKRCEQGFYRMLIGIKGRLQKMDEKQPSSKITAGAVVHGGTIMAIFEKTIRNKNFDKLLRKLEQEIPDSSWSADLEAGSDFKEGDARCSVRVFERYSMMGGNRLSLTLTMFQNADSPIRLSAITAGGSQAVFFKVNTLGEESFLNDVKNLLEEILEE